MGKIMPMRVFWGGVVQHAKLSMILRFLSSIG